MTADQALDLAGALVLALGAFFCLAAAVALSTSPLSGDGSYVAVARPTVNASGFAPRDLAVDG